jgi:hypothetical protein
MFFVSGRVLGGRASSSFQVGWVGWMLTWVDGIYVTFGVLKLCFGNMWVIHSRLNFPCILCFYGGHMEPHVC